MVILDATIVNVALPSIQTPCTSEHEPAVDRQRLHARLRRLPAARRSSRRPDRTKAPFPLRARVFTAASLANGLATTPGMLIGFRALQGFGAALISPAALSIISTTFAEGKERARALGVWAAIAIGGSAFGLVLGGWLTQSFSWRWIFFVNVPVGIFAFLAVAADRARVDGRARTQALRRGRRDHGDRRPDGAGLRDRDAATPTAGDRRRRSARSSPRPCCSPPSS